MTLSPKAAAFAGMLDRLGGDSVSPSMAYDGYDRPIEDALFEHVQWLEARARVSALLDVARDLGVTLSHFTSSMAPEEVENLIRAAIAARVKGRT